MKRLLIFGIIVLAAFVRFYKITSVPPSLSWDETAIGYDAYSIMTTGKDQWGVKLPLAFKSFGEYKYPFHIYATAFFVKLFGLNEFSVRFGSAFFGVINILLLYFLVAKLLKSEKIALLSAFFLTISPWHIQFSRVSWETNYALFFFFLALFFFSGFIENQKKKYYLILSLLFFGITIFTYNALKVFVPLFVLSICLIYFRIFWENKKIFIVSLGIFFTFLIFNLFSPGLSGLSRFSQLNFLESQVVNTQAYQLTHIYKIGWLEVLAKQYFSHFSFRFLFISGDSNPRHSIQAVGELLWPDLLFIPVGLYAFLRKRDKKSLLFLTWFFLAPLPGAITREAPHASRAMMALGIYQITIAVGFFTLINFKYKYKKFLALFFFCLIIIPFLIYLKSYFKDYSYKFSQYWQYGYKEITDFIEKNYNKYDTVYITRKYGEPQIFLLFYLKYPPYKYQNDSRLRRDKIGDWVKVFSFDKFVFLDEGEVKEVFNGLKKTDKKVLFIGSPGNFPENTRFLREISFLDGEVAFQIVEHE